ncbi:hypothetical protein TTHERM_001006511 (macronuclear) [Tetrahymena thermophila SB210]|uniref:Uncharacterized protein n=1 Tax=Tetrahymena thermophila (strain SB210) TaxID=312017 RepID=W7X2J1_TETTS|nr:hypothetical protein TTHERM_001006511 [Tetrahymena thermophila SB210]EWS73465.1 hypothetical protein TTHERM_001006511 [Tetrahymena thermophila SB210]|eukprot:XP_012654001.1 hypothetical protein TTHERM_001006511 [Tetrahymena thermophila SB210]
MNEFFKRKSNIKKNVFLMTQKKKNRKALTQYKIKIFIFTPHIEIFLINSNSKYFYKNDQVKNESIQFKHFI